MAFKYGTAAHSARDYPLIYPGGPSRQGEGPRIWAWPMTSGWPGRPVTAFGRPLGQD
jgi:hypothetical protein